MIGDPYVVRIRVISIHGRSLIRKNYGCTCFSWVLRYATMSTPESLEDALDQEATQRIQALRDALDTASEALNRSSWTVGGHDGRDVDLDDVLTAIGAIQAALEEHGDDLMGLAALGGYPMATIGEMVGLSETAVPIRIARTKRLAPYAEKTGRGALRVSKRGLGAAAWALRHGDD